MASRASLIARLQEVVGPDHVLTDPAVMASYGRDWTGRWAQTPLAVVRPADTDQVSLVMRICSGCEITVVPQGGNTGLVGGSVPTTSGAVVLSTSRLDGHGEVDVARQQITVGAGVTIATLHQLASEQGLSYGVDLAARDAATIGGTVATNAGGIRVVHFGDTRSQVVGVEAVLPDGEVMSHLGGLPKDSAGYDVSRLLVGSEGTLAVITAVRVRLRESLPTSRTTALVGVPSLAYALQLSKQAASSREALLACEYFDNTGMGLVCDAASLPHPLSDRWPYYLLLETSGEPSLPEDADAAIDRRLWTYRERQPEAASTLGLVHSLDVAVPLDSLDDLLAHLPDLVSPHRVFTFGHLAEGNLHIQVSGPDADDDEATDRVLRAVADLGGSISSEHGIGRAKTEYLHLCRDAAELGAMRRIKQAIDPLGTLNPGVLFTSPPPRTATMSS